ncbi:fibrinogen-like protein 1 [Ostrea edulis]|uniref:fibrinogen-like protein 1 n=1 Tax=Ostrea edulis TaxID=37623 RepID=UPI0024AEA234|nr:fibrinogen-like protein 1 [Ostrea edulis]
MASRVSTLLVYAYIVCNVYDTSGLHNVQWGTQLTGRLIDVVAGVSFLDCIKECQSRKRCLSVNYRRGTLFCELNSVALNSAHANVESTSVYSGMQSWEKILEDPCADTPCGDQQKCTSPSAGDVNKYSCQMIDCGPVDTSNNPDLVEIKGVGYPTIGVGSRRGFRCEGFLNSKIIGYIQCLPDGVWSTQKLQCVCDCRGFSSMMDGTTTINDIPNIPYTMTLSHEWLIIQRRCGGTESFSRTWNEYKKGFGSYESDFWIGNEIMHQLATDGFKVLRVEMMDYNGQMYFAQYTNLQIDSETDNYKIHLHDGEYSGNFSDELLYHNHMEFTTMDRDNDNHEDNCAEIFRNGWWYNHCFHVNLNGLGNDRTKYGIRWRDDNNGYTHMKFVRMMIRRP